jgi:hypothetical protein
MFNLRQNQTKNYMNNKPLMSICVQKIYVFVAVLLFSFVSNSQVNIPNTTPVVIDFSSTMPTSVGTNPSTAFAGAGFSPNPTIAGRLNSNAWDIQGFSFGTLGFGGTQTVDAFGRGSINTGVISHGIYAYTELPGSVANPALLVQPAAGEFAPGSIILRLKNTNTVNLTQIEVSYNLFVRNDENSSSSFNFSHSPDNVIYENESALDYVSPDAADPFQWVSVGVSPSRSIIISGINVAPGAFYYLRWSCEDVTISGDRDEFGLDDITITGTFGAPAPEINVTGNGLTILNGDTTPRIADGTEFASSSSPIRTFGPETTQTVTFRIQNIGGATLNVSNVVIGGPHASDFTIYIPGASPPPTGTIAGVSGSVISFRELSIIFNPSAPGLRQAVVYIYNDDSNENPYVFNIQGYAFDPVPEIDLQGNTVNTGIIVDGSMIPITSNNTLFSNQVVGGTGEIKDYKIRSIGTMALTLTGASPYVTISGANPSDFTLMTWPNSGTINTGFFKTFSIKFNPTAPGIRTAIVSIANNDPNENPYDFLIQGVGITPEMDVFGDGQPIVNGSTIPSFVNDTFFDYVNINATTLDRVYTIQNNGTHTLSIGAITISGAAASDYTVITSPSATLAVGASTTFVIRFDPSVVGLRDATVSIVNNDLNENPYVFAINGYGVDYIPCSYGILETIAVQDFETTPATPTWGYTNSGASLSLVTTNGYAVSGDGGATNKFIGARALQNVNGTGNVTMSNINTTQFSDVQLNFRIGAFSATASEGLDLTDVVKVSISSNGGTTWSDEVRVTGNVNSVWSFVSGIASTSKSFTGTNTPSTVGPVTVPSGTINYQTTEGYSTVVLTNLPKVANLAVRFTINNNANEAWVIDNVTLFGRREVSSTWNGTAWNNGVPTSSIIAILDGDYNTSIQGDLSACKCQINSGRLLTVSSNTNALIQSNLVNNGTIVIENSGSLVQRNDYAVNSASITMKRDTTPMKLYDYTYWSSPVSGQTLTALSPGSTHFFEFNPTIANWQFTAGSTTMTAGKGYIVRSPNSFTSTPAVFNGQFVGNVNNGFTQIPVINGTSNWNLIGNPYPSAINADLFLGYAGNTGVIGGTIYLWTHNTPLTNNVYTTNDYAVYNLVGGVGTSAINSGVNNTNPTGKIASGQGFFVKALANGNVTFLNSMRVLGSNNSFFRTNSLLSVNQESNGELEKHRLWLNLTNTQGAFKQTLIGYVENATNELDRDFDGTTLAAGNVINFYSICNNETLAIQGRTLPFVTEDVVPLGYSSTITGNFEISIERKDGLFNSLDDIILEDKELQTYHNLKESSYSFFTNAGTFNERFLLRYSSQALSNPENNLDYGVQVYVNNHQLTINSKNDLIESIKVYDILGRNLFSKEKINADVFSTMLNETKQSLIVKIKLNNGIMVTKKVIAN